MDIVQDPDDNSPTVVAITKHRSSIIAVRWAIANLLMPQQTLILVHVRTRHVAEANGGSVEEVFGPLRTCCARKGVGKKRIQEIVLEGTDVHSPILDYINHNKVTKIVLCNSSKGVVTRFWTPDVPAMINKAAPAYCSVYVIAKGKVQSIRPAAQQSDSLAHHSRAPLEQDDGIRKLDGRLSLEKCVRLSVVRKTADDYSENQNRRFKNDLDDNLGSTRSRRLSKGSHTDFDFIRVEGFDDPASKPLSANEILRLKQKVKQTMNMYNTICREAIPAQKQINAIEQLKQDELSRVEQAYLTEDVALALIEMEKAKCRAAIEAAEKAQKIAEKEIKRRMYAEMKAKREAEEKNRVLDVLSDNDDRCRKYTIEEIVAATDNFSRSMMIGEGGYGPVFKGKLDHTTVAIKILRPDAAQGRKQFQQEVDVLSSMRHPNMVILMGACPEYGCLVYEYMDNGSLEDRLFRKGNTPPIPWGIRFQIAADIATGLLFLHQAKPEPLVHRDLKPGNILLDHHYTCKISDVGLAKLVPPSVANSVTQYHMTSAAGTFCYIDPEYQQTGKLGTKSDIYSLGVILLQLITARPPMGLSHHVEKAVDKEMFADLLDPTLPEWPVEMARGLAKLALKCTELRKKDRPDLGKEILPELNKLKEYGLKHGLSQWHTSLVSSPRINFS